MSSYTTYICDLCETSETDLDSGENIIGFSLDGTGNNTMTKEIKSKCNTHICTMCIKAIHKYHESFISKAEVNLDEGD